MPRPARLAAALVAALLLGPWAAAAADALPAAECPAADTAGSRVPPFARRPADVSGADYARPIELPDGRALWLLQDVFLGADDDLRDDAFVHNAALVQDSGCWRLLRQGSAGTPAAWLGAGLTEPLHRWFWPMDAEMGADGYLHVFVVEMRNPAGTGAAIGALPAAAWRARVDPTTVTVEDLQPAGDPGERLYGWSVVTSGRWSFLYGHCYQQFRADTFLASNPTCSPSTYLARVPAGRFDVPYEYWDGTAWRTDPERAFPVSNRGLHNAMSVEVVHGRFVSVTKLDDWWGDEVVVDVADRPEGPWRVARRFRAVSRCGDACVTYAAFLAPWTDGTRLVVSLSGNAWDMAGEAMPDGRRYRPWTLLVRLGP